MTPETIVTPETIADSSKKSNGIQDCGGSSWKLHNPCHFRPMHVLFRDDMAQESPHFRPPLGELDLINRIFIGSPRADSAH